jgi:hypothetical protein
VRQPFRLDVSKAAEYPKVPNTYDLVYNANMAHISEWACTEGLFALSSSVLKPASGRMVMYGPFAVDGRLEPESNVKFDAYLKERNSAWGIRDIDDLKAEAEKNGMEMVDKHEMPANNKILVWRKK